MADDTRSKNEIYVKAPRPVSDLSLRAVRIGRVLDRLGPGQYVITLTKKANAADQPETWAVRIAQDLTVRELEV